MALKKSSKSGQHADYCKAYRNNETRAKHKALKLVAHLTRYGYTDGCAVNAYNNLVIIARSQKGLPVSVKQVPSTHKKIKPKVAMDPSKPTPGMPELLLARR